MEWPLIISDLHSWKPANNCLTHGTARKDICCAMISRAKSNSGRWQTDLHTVSRTEVNGQWINERCYYVSLHDLRDLKLSKQGIFSAWSSYSLVDRQQFGDASLLQCDAVSTAQHTTAQSQISQLAINIYLLVVYLMMLSLYRAKLYGH